MPTISIPIVPCAVCGKSTMLNTMRDCNMCQASPVCPKCIKETLNYGNFCPKCYSVLSESQKQLVLNDDQTIRGTEEKGLKFVKIGFIGLIPVVIILNVIFYFVVGPAFNQTMGGLGGAVFAAIGFWGLYMIYKVHPTRRQRVPLPL